MKYIRAILFGLFIVLLLKTAVVSSYYIPYSGMENSLYEGDCVLVNKWSYGLRLPFVSWFGYHRIGTKRVEANDIVVYNQPSHFSSVHDLTKSPIFISRCVGIPGDTLYITSKGQLYTSLQHYPAIKQPYLYDSKEENRLEDAMHEAHIRGNKLVAYQGNRYIRYFNTYEIKTLQALLETNDFFELYHQYSTDSAHFLLLPGKNRVVKISAENLSFYAQLIRNYEQKEVIIKEGQLYIDQQLCTNYRFTQDYYWMIADNGMNQQDSRSFGVVPASHIIGKAFTIWFSKLPQTSLIEGYQWERFFKTVK
jgi:signal peptidase I